jgi:hypothetical protein
MQDWINHNASSFILFLLLGWVLFWSAICYLIATISGWRLLAKRFCYQGPEYGGTKWSWQSGRMRGANYNGCLVLGADSSALFLKVFPLFRCGHPPLLVPWNEVTVSTVKVWFLDRAELRLGSTEQISLRIQPTLAARLQAAAGSSWPGSAFSGTGVPAPPPPVG